MFLTWDLSTWQAGPNLIILLRSVSTWSITKNNVSRVSTVDYAKMRGLSDSDIWLGSDLGVKKALIKLTGNADINDGSQLDSQAVKPWRSYLTFQCWNLLS